MIRENYNGYTIVAETWEGVAYFLFYGPKMPYGLSDTRTVSGDKLQSDKQAVNEAKKNINYLLK